MMEKLPKEGHVKIMRTSRRACVKWLMTVNEAKEIETVAYGALFTSPTILLGIQREAKIFIICIQHQTTNIFLRQNKTIYILAILIY